MLLAGQENWEEFGDTTPEEASQFFNDILDDYLESEFQMVGQISAWTAQTAMPFGWLPMLGQTVLQADYPELTAVAPASWKSGANLTIADMRQRTLFMFGGAFPLPGNFGGNNNVALTIPQMPIHTHMYNIKNSVVLTAPGAVPAVAPINTGAASDITGEGASFDNRPAFMSVWYGIYAGR
jgi:microcystin-dependent protein